MLINSATAVPRKIYRGFATYLASQGFTVLTYDYRGIGGSRPRLAARLQRAHARLGGARCRGRDRSHAQVWPKLPLAVVGHSFGGQALGLVPNNAEVSRALFVAAQAGYWRLFHSPEKYRVYAMLRLIGSPIARVHRLCAGRLGIGEDLPRDVFLEWTGLGDEAPLFLRRHDARRAGEFPSLSRRAARDLPHRRSMGDPAAVDLLCSGFTGTTPERIDVRTRAMWAHARSAISDSSAPSIATRCGAMRRRGLAGREPYSAA